MCYTWSDTGSEAPERCVFGIMLNISAFLGIVPVLFLCLCGASTYYNICPDVNGPLE